MMKLLSNKITTTAGVTLHVTCNELQSYIQLQSLYILGTYNYDIISLGEILYGHEYCDIQI